MTDVVMHLDADVLIGGVSETELVARAIACGAAMLEAFADDPMLTRWSVTPEQVAWLRDTATGVRAEVSRVRGQQQWRATVAPEPEGVA